MNMSVLENVEYENTHRAIRILARFCHDHRCPGDQSRRKDGGGRVGGGQSTRNWRGILRHGANNGALEALGF